LGQALFHTRAKRQFRLGIKTISYKIRIIYSDTTFIKYFRPAFIPKKYFDESEFMPIFAA
jgi:hypothetical protein